MASRGVGVPGAAMGMKLKLDDEPGRLAALGRYDILDTAAEDEFDQIVQLVQQVFGMPMAAVTLVDADRQWFKARRGLGVAETPREIAFCHHTIAAADGLAVEDAATDPRFADSPLVTGDPNIRSYLGAPLRTPDGYQVGALCIIGNESRRFSLADREILQRFSDVVVSHLELRQMASSDSLTGLMTRRAFDQAMYDALARGAGAGVLLVDLDHFKQVNDRHGHAVGDEVLRAAAATIAVVGSFGAIGRLGGEEFGVLLPADGDAPVVAEGVRRAIAAMAVPGHPAMQVTVSIGLSVAIAGDTTDSWLKRADDALYAAKRAGRDRVCAG